MTANRIHLCGRGKVAFSFKKKEIPEYVDSYFWKWQEVWWWWHMKGTLPYGTGWYDLPAHVSNTIRLFENLYNMKDDK
jgi:hypothetical protein